MPGPEAQRVALAAIPVLVLAAGRGRRMGGPKALMTVAGRAWWEWQSERLAATGMTAVWVVSPAVRAVMMGGLTTRSESATQLVEASDESPMFESIRAGLEFVRGRKPVGVFVLPVDVPVPRGDVWKALAGAGEVSVPTYGGKHGHPIWLPWTLVERDVLTAGPGARLDAIIMGHAAYVAVEDRAVSTNLNTPEDVREWERW